MATVKEVVEKLLKFNLQDHVFLTGESKLYVNDEIVLTTDVCACESCERIRVTLPIFGVHEF